MVWKTKAGPDGSFYFEKTVNGIANPVLLKGVSLCGMEYVPMTRNDKANLWLSFFDPKDVNSRKLSIFRTVVFNMIQYLINNWKVNVIRVPICVSAFAEGYNISFQGDKQNYSYPFLVKIVIDEITKRNVVAIVDGHVWAVNSSKQFLYGQGKSYTNPNLTPTATQAYQTMDQSLEELLDTTTGKPTSDFLTAWSTIVSSLSSVTNPENVWFEPVNEPFFRSLKDDTTQFNLWKTFFNEMITSIRQTSSNIIIVNGLDRAYDFRLAVGKSGLFSNMENIAFGVHPFQTSSCCGLITRLDSQQEISNLRSKFPLYKSVSLQVSRPGYNVDQSLADPYENVYCNYPGSKPLSYAKDKFFNLPGATDNINLINYRCNSNYYSSQSQKLPPCGYNPDLYDVSSNKLGTFLGHCPDNVKSALNSKTSPVPLSGWDLYFLGMRTQGPLIATAFGTFDCSLPFLQQFFSYTRKYNISWVAFGVQPYLPFVVYSKIWNPCNLLCLTVPAIKPQNQKQRRVLPVLSKNYVVGNYFECYNSKNCSSVLNPIGNDSNQYGMFIVRQIPNKILTFSPSPSSESPTPSLPTRGPDVIYEETDGPSTSSSPITTSAAPTTTSSAPSTTSAAPTTSSIAPTDEPEISTSYEPTPFTSESPTSEFPFTSTTSSPFDNEDITTSAPIINPEEKTTESPIESSTTQTPIGESQKDFDFIPIVIIYVFMIFVFLVIIISVKNGIPVIKKIMNYLYGMLFAPVFM